VTEIGSVRLAGRLVGRDVKEGGIAAGAARRPPGTDARGCATAAARATGLGTKIGIGTGTGTGATVVNAIKNGVAAIKTATALVRTGAAQTAPTGWRAGLTEAAAVEEGGGAARSSALA